MTEKERYKDCLINGRPYFGSYMFALQGEPIRHVYMQELVRLVCSTNNQCEMKILEIGSWAGGSAISWAEAVKKFNNSNGEVVCIDHWAPYFDPSTISETNKAVYEEMYNHSKSNDIFELFLHNTSTAGYSDVISPFRGNSDKLLPLFKNESFDIVFIDGDHRYSQALKDILNSMNLVKNGGFLCGDDLELQIHQVDFVNALKYSHKDYILDPKTETHFHPGVTLAVGKIIGNVSAFEGFWLVQKCSECWNSVDLNICARHPPSHLLVNQSG